MIVAAAGIAIFAVRTHYWFQSRVKANTSKIKRQGEDLDSLERRLLATIAEVRKQLEVHVAEITPLRNEFGRVKHEVEHILNALRDLSESRIKDRDSILHEIEKAIAHVKDLYTKQDDEIIRLRDARKSERNELAVALSDAVLDIRDLLRQLRMAKNGTSNG